MVVPSTAFSFRAAVSALWSLDGGGCVFSDLHVPLGPLCTTSGEDSRPGMPESVVREELESLGIHVQGVTQRRSRPS